MFDLTEGTWRNLFLLTIALVPIVLISCGTPAETTEQAEMGDANTHADAVLQISVDPRIELLTAMQIVAGYEQFGLITRYKFSYVEEVRQHFEPFADHPVVELFQGLVNFGFVADAPVIAMLHYGPPPELEPLGTVPDDIVQRAGGRKNLDKFIEQMCDFAVASDFMTFFEEHKPFYATVESAIREAVQGISPAYLEDYYGFSQNSYQIVPSLLSMHGGYGPRIERGSSTFDTYNVMGPYGADENGPTFASSSELDHIVRHEFSHSFTNPLVDEYWAELEPLAPYVFEPVREQMPSQGYGIWRACCNEYFVRAAVVRITAVNDGEEAAAKLQQMEIENKSFTALGVLTEALKEYEAHRDQYKSLKEFMPVLVKKFVDATTPAESE